MSDLDPGTVSTETWLTFTEHTMALEAARKRLSAGTRTEVTVELIQRLTHLMQACKPVLDIEQASVQAVEHLSAEMQTLLKEVKATEQIESRQLERNDLEEQERSDLVNKMLSLQYRMRDRRVRLITFSTTEDMTKQLRRRLENDELNNRLRADVSGHCKQMVDDLQTLKRFDAIDYQLARSGDSVLSTRRIAGGWLLVDKRGHEICRVGTNPGPRDARLLRKGTSRPLPCGCYSCRNGGESSSIVVANNKEVEQASLTPKQSKQLLQARRHWYTGPVRRAMSTSQSGYTLTLLPPKTLAEVQTIDQLAHYLRAKAPQLRPRKLDGAMTLLGGAGLLTFTGGGVLDVVGSVAVTASLAYGYVRARRDRERTLDLVMELADERIQRLPVQIGNTEAEQPAALPQAPVQHQNLPADSRELIEGLRAQVQELGEVSAGSTLNEQVRLSGQRLEETLAIFAGMRLRTETKRAEAKTSLFEQLHLMQGELDRLSEEIDEEQVRRQREHGSYLRDALGASELTIEKRAPEEGTTPKE